MVKEARPTMLRRFVASVRRGLAEVLSITLELVGDMFWVAQLVVHAVDFTLARVRDKLLDAASWLKEQSI